MAFKKNFEDVQMETENNPRASKKKQSGTGGLISLIAPPGLENMWDIKC
jgi:hypothetical protein